MEYVVGFLFNNSLQKVYLICKQKPQWQKGYWNGIGGKIEKEESPLTAMNREFFEEAGIEKLEWNFYCLLKVLENLASVFFYCCKINDDIFKTVKSKESELIINYYINNLPINIIPNLTWLIPFAKMFLQKEYISPMFLLEQHKGGFC